MAWVVKGREIVGLGGGSLEQPRQWLRGSGPVSPLGVPSQPELPGRPCGGTGAELGYCERGGGGGLTMLRDQQISTLAGPFSKSPVQLALSNEEMGNK